MTENKNIRRRPRPQHNPKNKEQASNNKRRWKKHHRKPKKNLDESLQELQAFINGKYHTQ